MVFIHIVAAFSFHAIVVQAVVLPNRRDTFDPNRLMQNYMGVRTDQSSYGSFHPNDLIETIQSYFKNGVTQTLPDSQWGLSVYNPTYKISQYVSELNSPGGLGPEINKQNVVTTHGDQNQFVQMTGFNPDEVNKVLINSFDGKANANSQTPMNYGFDADAVNKQLMLDINSSQQKSVTFQTDARISPTPQISAVSTTIAPEKQPDAFGFDPDRLNAHLFSGLNYDPNSAMSPTSNFQSSSENAANMTLGRPINSVSGNFASSSNKNNGSVGGTNGGIGNYFQLGRNTTKIVSQNGANTGSSSNSSSNGGMATTAFDAAELLPARGTVNQDKKYPPGVQNGSNSMKQTEVTVPAPYGIGGI